MYTQALAGLEQTLGPEHTLTLTTVKNLGMLYSQTGNYEEAKEMLERALKGFEKAVGLERISVCVPALDVMAAIATLSDSQGCTGDARM